MCRWGPRGLFIFSAVNPPEKTGLFRAALLDLALLFLLTTLVVSPMGGPHSTGGVGKGDGGEEKQRRAKKSANAAFGGQ